MQLTEPSTLRLSSGAPPSNISNTSFSHSAPAIAHNPMYSTTQPPPQKHTRLDPQPRNQL